MTYIQWFQSHTDKHKKIVDKLLARDFSPEQIVEYFEFEKMVRNENDFCLLYATETKCHNIPNLNCYWCACPHFRFNDLASPDPDGITVFSYCAIHAPLGKAFHYANAIHHDCSSCTIPHEAKTILKKFSKDWKETMKACNLVF